MKYPLGAAESPSLDHQNQPSEAKVLTDPERSTGLAKAVGHFIC